MIVAPHLCSYVSVEIMHSDLDLYLTAELTDGALGSHKDSHIQGRRRDGQLL